MFALLLAMQAAGMVTDYMGTARQAKFSKMGADVEQAGIEANINMTRLETEESSLAAMKQLRQNLGTQIAVNAARGTRTGAGSALATFNESINNASSDERIRRLNAMGNENQLRGGAAVKRLQYMSNTSKLWQGFGSRTINRFPSTVSGWQEYGKAFKEGFGLTSSGK